MDERITTPPACASPDGALPLSAPTPAAGAQTGAVVPLATIHDVEERDVQSARHFDNDLRTYGWRYEQTPW